MQNGIQRPRRDEDEEEGLCQSSIPLFIVIGYFIFEIIINWKELITCERPIHLWLLVLFTMILVLRKLISMIDEGHYNAYISQRILVFLFFPILIYWTLQGVAWYQIVQENTPDCLNEEMTMVLFFWIFACNLMIIVYVMTLAFVLFYQIFSRRRT
mmetsp:Transcript_34385/g.33589  ORF Transcript_34385/g.33589 Transcript_34385/m.33589 type:complete len:156 (-) Transcript_34385:392-859(-)